MTGGFLVLFVCVYLVMTIGAMRQARAVIAARLHDLSLDVVSWREGFDQMRATTNSGALAKTRMLARIIQYDPSVLKNPESLKELAKALEVDSICISDAEGVLVASTEPGFLGFRMDSTEQSGAFMPAIYDKAFELVQDPQERGIDHEIVQYAGVARLDEPGIVQVCYESENVFQFSDIELMRDIVKDLPIGKGGRFIILEDGDDPVVFASGDPSENGFRLSELGFLRDPLFPSLAILRGVIYFYEPVTITGESRRAFALMTKYDVFGSRNRGLLFITGTYLLFFVLLFFLLSWQFRRTVTDGFSEVNRSLDKIIAGDLTQTVNVRSNPEFLALSDGINTMVSGLKKNLTESKRRVRSENELAKSIQRTLVPAPGRLFPQFPTIDFASGSVLAPGRGGDLVETFVTSDGRPGFLMAEAVGESVAACLSMMKFRTVLQFCAMTATPSAQSDEILKNTLEVLEREKVFRHRFLSVFLGTFDIPSRTLYYVNAGFHPPFMRATSDSGFVRSPVEPGAVFTTGRPVEFQLESIEFKPGDIFFACSDGVFTFADSERHLYTRKMLQAALDAAPTDSAESVIGSVLDSLRSFSGEIPPDDDAILAAFRFLS